jgi:hypothetical protein
VGLLKIFGVSPRGLFDWERFGTWEKFKGLLHRGGGCEINLGFIGDIEKAAAYIGGQQSCGFPFSRSVKAQFIFLNVF